MTKYNCHSTIRQHFSELPWFIPSVTSTKSPQSERFDFCRVGNNSCRLLFWFWSPRFEKRPEINKIIKWNDENVYNTDFKLFIDKRSMQLTCHTTWFLCIIYLFGFFSFIFFSFFFPFLYIWYDASSFDDKMYLTANSQTCILFSSMF